MTPENLYDALTNVKDALVDEAKDAAPAKKPVHWIRWGSIAAVAVLLLGVGGWTLGHWRLGSNFAGVGAGGGGHGDGSSVFMSYAGPVFPLTALDGGEGLTVQRHLTYDFSPWLRTWWSNEDKANSRAGLSEAERQEVLDFYNEHYPEGGTWRSSNDLLVTDAYTLANPTGEDKTVTLLYPFVSSLRELSKDTPALTADGEALETVLHAGGYSGGFQGVADGKGNVSEEQLNLAQLNSWEQYKALLSDGSYQETALGGFPDLSGTPVTVYRFTDSYGPEPDHKAGIPNPSIQACFDLDYEKTTVLSYGFHACRWDRENGKMVQGFSIPRPGWRDYGEPYFLYVLGEDIRNLTTGGYVTGGADEDTKKLDGCGVTVNRYETDLESALREAAGLMWGGADWDSAAGEIDAHRPDFALYFGLMKEFLCSYGALSESGPERYDNGWLEEMDFESVDRVFYLETRLTIPAGGERAVAADLKKDASFDFYCAHTDNQGIFGYDMVTRLGSTLDVTSQTARAVNTGGVEIVRQNYGFDWTNGVDEVSLDPEVEHYYLEVRRAAQAQ